MTKANDGASVNPYGRLSPRGAWAGPVMTVLWAIWASLAFAALVWVQSPESVDVHPLLWTSLLVVLFAGQVFLIWYSGTARACAHLRREQ